MPVRGHLIAYRAGAGMLGRSCGTRTPICCKGNGLVSSRAPRPNSVGFDRTIDESDRAVPFMPARRDCCPPLAAMEPAERWNGFRPGIEGGIPAIGRIEGTTIWTAFGHYRNGILLAPDTARRIEESVLRLNGVRRIFDSGRSDPVGKRIARRFPALVEQLRNPLAAA